MVISTHTLRGERDVDFLYRQILRRISTHTLRGERDNYDLTRCDGFFISTHTLRGERDFLGKWILFQ